MKLLVNKYIPEKLYGFCSDPEERFQVFFHLGSFKPGASSSSELPPPPPILGEEVEVEVDIDFMKGGVGDKAPRASCVTRIQEPRWVEGKVDTFDAHRGFGFVQGEDGVSYHLHKSEIINNRIPLTGQRVGFYAGRRMGRPRACHVNVMVDE